jgi:hypothetical protein
LDADTFVSESGNFTSKRLKTLNVAQQGGSKDGVRLTEIKIGIFLVNDMLSPAFKQIRQTI